MKNFYDIKEYPFLNTFISNIDIIAEELKTASSKNELIHSVLNPTEDIIEHYTNYWVKDNGFHPDQIGYDIRKGEYTTLAIFKKEFSIKHFNAEELFPKTLHLLEKVNGLYYSGFFKMFPQAELGSHVHNRKHLIFHLLLNDLENGECYMTCGDQTRVMKRRGDHVLFDYSVAHESHNASGSSRVNFVVDFNPF